MTAAALRAPGAAATAPWGPDPAAAALWKPGAAAAPGSGTTPITAAAPGSAAAPIVTVAPGVFVAVGAGPAEPGPGAGPAAVTRWRAAERDAARALLRRLLAAVAGPDAARAGLGARTGGRPYLIGLDIGVSLSHSGGLVAAAAHTGGGAVGVDVQAPYPAGDRLARRCCPALLRLPPAARAAELAWVWTVQEACAKAAGTGLAARPWTIPVAPGATGGAWRGLRWRALRGHCRLPLSCAYAEPNGKGSP